MTAEVAILNREAVVMAADSALTLGGTVGKVYNSANKLFALSRHEPVAVMVYGGGSFEGIPWATVVKEHRRRLSGRVFDTIEDHAKEFIGFLSSLARHVPTDIQREQVLRRARWELDQLAKSVDRETLGHVRDGNRVTDEMLMDLIESSIHRLEEDAAENAPTQSVAAREFRKAIEDWDALVGERLKDLPVTDAVKDRARALVRTSLRAATWSPTASGVVIGGFGTSQLFPALSHYLVDGVLAGQVRARQLHGIQIGWQRSAVICPFAQQDMVQTFMDGLHPDYPQAIVGFIEGTLELFASHFGDHVKKVLSSDEHGRLMDRMATARSRTVEGFQNQLKDLLETQHSDPIMSVVDMLPKEELAEMAEALVNLTSLKRRVTPEDETVGGPVDVAVISRGDGLIWIKRKHYFAPELNPWYFDRDHGMSTRPGHPERRRPWWRRINRSRGQLDTGHGRRQA